MFCFVDDPQIFGEIFGRFRNTCPEYKYWKLDIMLKRVS